MSSLFHRLTRTLYSDTSQRFICVKIELIVNRSIFELNEINSEFFLVSLSYLNKTFIGKIASFANYAQT